MAPAVHLSSIGLSHLERNPMSNLAQRAATVPRWSDLPLTRASKSYFLLGQNARGLWVIRENSGKKAGVFVSREAALRFARLCPEGAAWGRHCGGGKFWLRLVAEHAPVAIKGAGVACVIAATFARIFFRNALNIGLPIVECAEAAQRIEAGDTVEIDANSGRIINHTKGETYHDTPFPPSSRSWSPSGA